MLPSGRNLAASLAFALVAVWSLSALSQQATAGEPPKDAEDKKAEDKKAEDEKPDFPPFDEVSEGHEKISGFFDLYYDKKKDHLLCVIPKAMLGKNFLVASSIAGGPMFAGFMWDTNVVQWHERDKQLILMEPDLRYKRAEGSTVEDVVARTYTDRIVLATKIVSKRNGDPVIALDDVYKADRVGLSMLFGGSMDKSLSTWAKVKGFEKNIELAVDAAMTQDSKGASLARVHYSISELPQSDYKARAADDRVGYFLTAIKDYGRKHKDKTIFDRYIHRWRLRKADPKADLSDVHADDQIVFYIEKTVPVAYRRYVREGILEWNKAFEKIGLLNVMAVRQQTDTNEFKDLDPEDVRYNFFRWVVTGMPFAMGPSRVNPLTGQILDADILFDDSFIRVLYAQYERLAAKGPAAYYDPQFDEFIARHPQWNFVSQAERLLPNTMAYGGSKLSWEPTLMEKLAKRNPAFCTYAQGMTHEMVLANLHLNAEGGGGLTQKYLGQVIKWIVIHEVGHTLGLRHNFKASSWKTLEDILATTDPDVPTCGSVMDYNPALFAAALDDQPSFITSTIGPYDYWAIEYGYRHTDDELKTEEELLKAIASRSAEPGHAYGTDEDRGIFMPDPLVNVYDAGDDPIKYARHRMDMVKRLLEDLESRAVEDGESYSRLRRAFDALLFEYGRVAQFAARYVGGQYVNRDHKGDTDGRAPFVIVSTEKQRAALDFLMENVFSDKAFQFSPELLNKLGPGRWRHWDSDNYDGLLDYPLHDRIAATQYWALFHLVNPFTINRVYDAEVKVPDDEDAVTVPELVTTTTAAIWSELKEDPGPRKWTDRRPFVTSIRRSLQRAHLKVLIDVLLSRPGSTMPADAHSIVRLALKGLSQQIGDVLKGGDQRLDAFTAAHLDEAKTRIDRALEAEFEL